MTMDALDHRLLDDYQRDFPLLPRPFAAIGSQLGLTEQAVIDRLHQHRDAGRISRLGATVRPNTAAASTLAALAVPLARLEAVAAAVGAEPGVNHAYLREGCDWNLWFVATAPDAAALAESLSRIETATGLKVLDLRLKRAFNIDLGFALSGPRRSLGERPPADLSALQLGDRPILHALSQGLGLTARPYALPGLDEAHVIARIKTLLDAQIITRLGLILRHRALGWAANAMVVWDVPEARIDRAGPALAAVPGVTLCYQRQVVPGWRHGLFCMIHAQSRDQAMAVLDAARALPDLAGVDHKVLFSTRCFVQRGAIIQGKAA
ncbi:siroheme decarboxylase subunit beta [Paracoccus zhouxuedongae]|uniref:siroheme decarboxylase subunit beta n=1 Tax=Paracoccus sp. p4-l81 TaxID=3342806 RepID=UPI0035BBB05E